MHLCVRGDKPVLRSILRQQIPQHRGFPSAVKGQMAQDSVLLPELRGKMINDSKEQGMGNVFSGSPTKVSGCLKNASTLDKAGTQDRGSGRG